MEKKEVLKIINFKKNQPGWYIPNFSSTYIPVMCNIILHYYYYTNIIFYGTQTNNKNTKKKIVY